MLTHGSLFHGVGGFDLAAEWIGWQNVWANEIDKFCCEQSRRNFNHRIIQKDIRDLKIDELEKVDIITGGDPCQPNSVAGLGKGTSDDRYLWPEYYRIVQGLLPSWVLNENVSGSVANGVLDIKIDDLEREGYSCRAYSIPAEAVGALHQRARIWLVAYNPNGYRSDQVTRKIYATKAKESRGLEKEQHKIHFSRESVDLWSCASDSDSERFKKQHLSSFTNDSEERASGYFGFGDNAHGHISRDFLESAVVGMLNGLPEGLDYTQRNKRIKALGNAIVPQVAYEFFKAIECFEIIK